MSSNPALSQTIDSAALFGSIHHLAKVEKQISNCWTTRFKKYVCILSATPKFQPALYTLQVPFFFFLLFFFCLFSFLLFFPMKQSHNKTFFSPFFPELSNLKFSMIQVETLYWLHPGLNLSLAQTAVSPVQKEKRDSRCEGPSPGVRFENQSRV